VAPGTTVLGFPAIEVRKARRALPLVKHLPTFRKELVAHRRRLEQLETACGLTDSDDRE